MIYKIFRRPEWEAFTRNGLFNGSVHDQRDGFIHMCAASQLAETLAKHYQDVGKLVLASFNEAALNNVKWEVSRGGEDFPHIYGTIFHSTVDAHWPLVQNRHRIFDLPTDLP